MTAEAIPSVGSDSTNFLAVPNGGYPTPTGHLTTGHLVRDKPGGGNMLFVDGHAVWRTFKNIRVRYDANNQNVFFWF